MTPARATPLRLLLCVIALQGVSSLRCYSCTDTGDGSCGPGRAAVTNCPYPRDICLETITTMNISFTSLKVLFKACGFNATSESPLQKDNKAIAAVTTINSCATDLCNTLQFNAANFPLANISFGNIDYLNIYFKDCGRWGAGTQISLLNNLGLGVLLRRTLCTGDLCNQEIAPTIAPTPPEGAPRPSPAAPSSGRHYSMMSRASTWKPVNQALQPSPLAKELLWIIHEMKAGVFVLFVFKGQIKS
ncbi:uncharacterized protein [Pleurodeles waltl]|uniref:uncharacterized protein n=1 Tax=Pleurodeles waltl TaxID=8319 RepID=UPI0037096FCD